MLQLILVVVAVDVIEEAALHNTISVSVFVNLTCPGRRCRACYSFCHCCTILQCLFIVCNTVQTLPYEVSRIINKSKDEFIFRLALKSI